HPAVEHVLLQTISSGDPADLDHARGDNGRDNRQQNAPKDDAHNDDREQISAPQPVQKICHRSTPCWCSQILNISVARLQYCRKSNNSQTAEVGLAMCHCWLLGIRRGGLARQCFPFPGATAGCFESAVAELPSSVLRCEHLAV